MFQEAARQATLPVAILLATGATIGVLFKKFLNKPLHPQDAGKRAILPEHHHDIH